MQRGFVVTGTDTDVGKTIVGAGLTGALGGCYWKPIQAGLETATDSERVSQLTLAGSERIIPEAYKLTTACSPHEAARLDNVLIQQSELQLPETSRPLIVEGAGGVLVPINDQQSMLDLFAAWALPVILVARTKLGTINHSLLSIAALRSRDIDMGGVIFVGDTAHNSEQTICDRGGVEHLGRLPWLEPLDAATLAQAMRKHINLAALG